MLYQHRTNCSNHPIELKRLLLTKIKLAMVLTVKKGMNKKKLDEVLRNLKQTKQLDAKRHLGKVKWDEDALAYQKRIRDEWN
jgi:hypothetical protein